MTNPATAGQVQGSNVVCFPARDFGLYSLTGPSSQQNIAVRRLVARFGLSTSTAAAIASANKFGGAHA